MLTEIIALTILRADTLPSIYPVTQMNSTMKRSNILGGAFANQAGLAITSSQTELSHSYSLMKDTWTAKFHHSRTQFKFNLASLYLLSDQSYNLSYQGFSTRVIFRAFLDAWN